MAVPLGQLGLTTMATLHNPVNFEPRDYIVEDYLDNQRPQYCGQPIEVLEREIRAWEVEMQRIFGDGWISKIHRCIHCGNSNVRWITAVRHVPSGDVVTFGSDCTKRLGFADKMAFKLAQLQARAEARKVRFTIFHERQAFLAAHPAIVEAIACIDEPVHASNSFVKDVLAKLDHYGSLSEREVEDISVLALDTAATMHCVICGDDERLSVLLRFWSPDDGWRVGRFCPSCRVAGYASTQPQPDDYAYDQHHEQLMDMDEIID